MKFVPELFARNRQWMGRRPSGSLGPKGYSSVWPVLLCLLAAWPLVASGYSTRLTSSKLTISGAQVIGIVEVHGPDLEVAMGVTLRGLGRALAPALINTNTAKLSAYLSDNLRFEQSAGMRCPAEVVHIQPKEDNVVAEIRWQCSPDDKALTFVVTLLQEVDPAAQHIVTTSGDVRTFTLASASHARLSLR